MGLTEDPEIRVALAMNEDGTCCRHPNIAICTQVSGSDSGPNAFVEIQACRICASEGLAGGVRQRKSFALIIDQVQKFHADKSEWKAFKQNWSTNDNEEDEQQQQHESLSDNDKDHQIANEQQKQEEEKKDKDQASQDNDTNTNNNDHSFSVVDLQNLMRHMIQRMSQVHDWALTEKDKEQQILQEEFDQVLVDQEEQLEIITQDKLTLETTIESQSIERQALEATVKQQTELIAALQAQVEKQEKTIHQDLKMIKTIAMKRSNHPPEFSGIPESPRRKSKSPALSPPPQGNVKELSSRSLSLPPNEAPPRPPMRKKSNMADIIGTAATTTTTGDSATVGALASAVPLANTNTLETYYHHPLHGGGGDMSDNNSTRTREAPQLPVRQQSHFLHGATIITDNSANTDQTTVSGTNTTITTTTLGRTVSFNNQANNTPPVLPQRQTSQESTHDGSFTTSFGSGSGFPIQNANNRLGSVRLAQIKSKIKSPHSDKNNYLEQTVENQNQNRGSILFVPPEEQDDDDDDESESDDHEDDNLRLSKLDPSEVLKGADAAAGVGDSINLEPRVHDFVEADETREADLLRLSKLDPSQVLNNNKHNSGSPSEDVTFLPPGNDSDDEHAGEKSNRRISQNDPSAILSGMHVINNKNSTQLSPGMNAIQQQQKSLSSSRSISISTNTSTKKSTDTKQKSSQEISFIPNEEDTEAPPPPPPGGLDHHVDGNNLCSSPTRTHSLEINFDAGREFSMEGVAVVKRKSTIKDMQFVANDQLLVEASHAMSEAPQSPKKPTRNSLIPNETKNQKTFSSHLEGKSESQILAEQIYGKAAVATEQDEINDEYDNFDDSTDFFPQVYLECDRVANSSPVSALTTGSYLMDFGASQNLDEDDGGPRKSLHAGGFTKTLPLEMDFESDEDEDEEPTHMADKLEDRELLDKKPMPEQQKFHPPQTQPSFHPNKSGIASPTAQRVSGSAIPNYMAAAASAVASDKNKKNPKQCYAVDRERVQDKYGDGGEYTGTVSVGDNLPHDFGKMNYDNNRLFEGDWRDGRWYVFLSVFCVFSLDRSVFLTQPVVFSPTGTAMADG
jgi:hypothetical protein